LHAHVIHLFTYSVYNQNAHIYILVYFEDFEDDIKGERIWTFKTFTLKHFWTIKRLLYNIFGHLKPLLYNIFGHLKRLL